MKKFIVFLLVFVLLVSLLSFSAFAAALSGDGSLFSVVLPNGYEFRMFPPGVGQPGLYVSSSGRSAYPVIFILPYPLSDDGSFTIDGPLFSGSVGVMEDIYLAFYDSSCNLLSQIAVAYDDNASVPSGTNYISISQTFSQNYNGSVSFNLLSTSFIFYDFDYDMSSSGGADLSGLSDILTAWDSGPYDIANSGTVYDFDNMALISEDFDSVDYQTAFYALCRSSTLMSVFATQMWTNTSYDSEGNLVRQGFTYNRVNGAFPSSQTVVSVNNLPEYLNQLGSELTTGLNKLQRDNVLIWDHIDHTYSAVQDLQSSQSDLNSTLQDALYEETDSSPSENWSVAQWLKGIFNSISTFFTNFWSPGESALKDASEDAYTELADSDLVISDTDVSSWASFSSSLPSLVDSGVSPNELLDVPSETWFSEFWSDTTLSNLSVPSNTRGSKSSSTPFLDANSAWLSRMLGGEKNESR